MAKRGAATHKGVALKRHRSGLRGALTRAIKANDPKAVARAAGKLARSLRPKKDRNEAKLARQLAKAVTTGHASDASDPRIQAITRKITRGSHGGILRRSPIEEAPWFLESRIASLHSYCVEPGAFLSHYVREAKNASIIWSGNLAIASDFGRADSWKGYRNRARAKLREVIKGHAGSWEMWALIEDRCMEPKTA